MGMEKEGNSNIVFILILVFLAVGAFFYLYRPVPISQNDSLSNLTDSKNVQPIEEKGGVVMDTNELKIEDLTVGTGDEAVPGKKVTVHYTGTLTNGQKFDSSVDRGQPFTFNLGQGSVIQGWDKGVAGMKVGGKRKLTIPPHLGYGERGAGETIPPNSTLIFEVELLKVE